MSTVRTILVSTLKGLLFVLTSEYLHIQLHVRKEVKKTMNIKKTIATGVALVGLLAATAFPAFAANDKLTMYGSFTGNCSTGATGGVAEGFANLNEVDTTINGVVSLKGASPNSTYIVYLVAQTCASTILGTITTNGQGNGNLSVEKTPAPGTPEWTIVAGNLAVPSDVLLSTLGQ